MTLADLDNTLKILDRFQKRAKSWMRKEVRASTTDYAATIRKLVKLLDSDVDGAVQQILDAAASSLSEYNGPQTRALSTARDRLDELGDVLAEIQRATDDPKAFATGTVRYALLSPSGNVAQHLVDLVERAFTTSRSMVSSLYVLRDQSRGNPSAKQVRKALRRAGCEEVRQKGSHVQVVCPPGDRRATVPVHGSKDLKRGTLRAIERSAGVDVDGDGRPKPRERRLANKLSDP